MGAAGVLGVVSGLVGIDAHPAHGIHGCRRPIVRVGVRLVRMSWVRMSVVKVAVDHGPGVRFAIRPAIIYIPGMGISRDALPGYIGKVGDCALIQDNKPK